MAIKGKSRTRSRKAVTRGPKPAYTPVRQPLLQRRSFRIGVVVVLVAGATFGIWYGLNKQHHREAEQELKRAERVAVSKYQVAVETGLQGLGKTIPPGGFDLLPDLKRAIDDLKSGNASAKDALAAGQSIADSAKRGWETIDVVDVANLIRDKGFTPPLTTYLLASKPRLVQGLKLYEQVALMLQDAAATSGAARDDLLASAGNVLDVATSVFADGYTDYVNAQFEVGLFTPTNPAIPAGGLPSP